MFRLLYAFAKIGGGGIMFLVVYLAIRASSNNSYFVWRDSCTWWHDFTETCHTSASCQW